MSIAEVAEKRASREDMPFWKPLGEFLDAFYEPGADLERMLADEPVAEISAEEAAFLAAAAEYLSSIYRIAPPAWIGRPRYFLTSAHFPDDHGPAWETTFIAESPLAFRKRFIFTEGRPLRRKRGPVFQEAKADA